MDESLSFSDELLNRAERLANSGQTRDARRCLEHFISLPEVSAASRVAGYRLLAEIHTEQKELKSARRCLAAALILEPTCPDLHYRMGQAILADGEAQPKRAWNHLNLAIAMDPSAAKLWSALGRAALQLHRPKEAVRCFRKCLSLRPSEPHVLDELARGLANLNSEDLSAVMMQKGSFALRPQDRNYLQRQFRMYVALESQERVSEEPAILSFPSAGKLRKVSEAGAIIRIDRASSPAPRLLAFNVNNADK
ncbi:tetratricopeptide repeat protein [Telmatocola sphagniphila]|jgi:predicted Zn-dependent protease|uniref:Tetratricopeptide repeat protein n=1 Tax=Telmatocola sphagniphila TaxID=1123043 RepID=A0A8E6B338_9BACT|nr:tetratricopeptide repeat protein [Telmatocola sphagniphila]QVL31048.1 tetratricopeptide repeat protein [Telmatocola sphagniphila]